MPTYEPFGTENCALTGKEKRKVLSQTAKRKEQIPRCDGRKSAVLAEFSAVLVEISKRLVNFCTPKGRFSDKVSARRVEDEAKLVSASHPEPKQHLGLAKVSARRAEDEAKLVSASHSEPKRLLDLVKVSAFSEICR